LFQQFSIFRASSFSAGQGKSTVHEIGHFLGLFHTFYPWDLSNDDAANPCAFGAGTYPTGQVASLKGIG
jgi:hypothetical protein